MQMSSKLFKWVFDISLGSAGVYAVAPPANSGITLDQYSIYLRQTGDGQAASASGICCCRGQRGLVLMLADCWGQVAFTSITAPWTTWQLGLDHPS